MKVAVIFASRGLCFSQTADELLQNLKGVDHKIFFSHRRPIPDCFEIPTEQALFDRSFSHLFFCEEDMVLPPDILKKMLEANANAVTCDYPVSKRGQGAVFYDKGGSVVFCGTGCLLVKREVFTHLKRPYFTTKIRWNPQNYGESIRLVAVKGNSGYGTHDVTFCIKLWKTGILIKVLPVKLAQRKLVSLGKSGSNDGAHRIEVWQKIVKNYALKEIQALPIAPASKTKLVSVSTPSGEISTTQEHAERLVSKKLAVYPPKRFTIIDDSAVKL